MAARQRAMARQMEALSEERDALAARVLALEAALGPFFGAALALPGDGEWDAEYRPFGLSRRDWMNLRAAMAGE